MDLKHLLKVNAYDLYLGIGVLLQFFFGNLPKWKGVNEMLVPLLILLDHE